MAKIWPKNWFFVSFWKVFFVYALWITPQDFVKWKTLLIHIFVVSSISIAYVVGKLKIFKVSCIDSAFMNWPLFGIFWLLFPQLLFNLDEILLRGSPIRQTHCLKNPSKFWNLAQIERTESLWFWSILGPSLLLENQKYA